MLSFSASVQVSLITSLLVALATIGAGYSLYQVQRAQHALKVHIWLAAFFLIGAAELNNGIHVLDPYSLAGAILGKLVDLYRVLAVALFLCGAAYDLLGKDTARRWLFASVALGIALWIVDSVTPVFSILLAFYELLIMLASFVIYSWLATRFEYHGAGWMALGAVFFLTAVVLFEHRRERMEWMLLLDDFHISSLLRLFGLVAATIGLRQSLAPPDLERRVRPGL